jgi:hypothetical protein
MENGKGKKNRDIEKKARLQEKGKSATRVIIGLNALG